MRYAADRRVVYLQELGADGDWFVRVSRQGNDAAVATVYAMQGYEGESVNLSVAELENFAVALLDAASILRGQS